MISIIPKFYLFFLELVCYKNQTFQNIYHVITQNFQSIKFLFQLQVFTFPFLKQTKAFAFTYTHIHIIIPNVKSQDFIEEQTETLYFNKDYFTFGLIQQQKNCAQDVKRFLV